MSFPQPSEPMACTFTKIRSFQALVIAFTWAACSFCCSPGCYAQDAVWSSMYDVASKAFQDEDYARAEKLTLETVEEAESLPKDGNQLVKTLALLYKIYSAEKKQIDADKVAARIESLGGYKEEPAKQEIRKAARKADEKSSDESASPNSQDNASKPEAKIEAAADRKGESKTDVKSGESKGLLRDKKTDPLQFEVSTKPDGKTADTPPKPAAKGEEPELNIEKELRDSQVASSAVSQIKTEGSVQTYKLKEVMKLEGHMGWSKCVDISPDATQALSGSADNTMRLWDLTTGKEIQKFEGHDEPVNSVAFSPSADRALSGSSDKTVRLWDLEAGTEIRKFLGHGNLVTCVAFAPIGPLIASGGYDGTVRIWDTQTGKEVMKLEGNLGTVKCLAFTPEADEIISGGTDKLLTLWNVKTGKKLRTFSGHSAEIATVSISDDGSRVVSAGRDTTVRTWDIDSGEELKTMTGHTNWVVKTRFISVDKVISGSLDKTFRIWDVDEGREDRIFNLQHFGMWSLGFSETGDKAITGSDDFTLRVWQMK
ncbi:MAG: hypothetical protein K2Y39_22990 [Candidatus Obscuribacterales bacterium]|nr:hypothetical protein [Candidatus Obscuribacterales bacterium]